MAPLRIDFSVSRLYFRLVLIRPKNRRNAPVSLSNNPKLVLTVVVSGEDAKTDIYSFLVRVLILLVQVTPTAAYMPGKESKRVNPLLFPMSSSAPGVITTRPSGNNSRIVIMSCVSPPSRPSLLSCGIVKALPAFTCLKSKTEVNYQDEKAARLDKKHRQGASDVNG